MAEILLGHTNYVRVWSFINSNVPMNYEVPPSTSNASPRRESDHQVVVAWDGPKGSTQR